VVSAKLVQACAGHDDAARLSVALEARRHVYTIAEDVMIFDDDIGRCHRHPEADSLFHRLLDRGRHHVPLQCDCTLNGITSEVENRDESIAGILDHVTEMGGDAWIEYLRPQAHQPGVRVVLVGLHQPRVADDVGGENGDAPPADAQELGERGCAWRRDHGSR
jgi:hypothetical protein